MARIRSRRRRQYGADAVLVGDQGEHDLNPGAGGQVGDLVVVVAGAQAAELGMGPVDQGSTLDDQVLAVVEQGSQVSGRADSRPDRRQLRFTRGDPGDGQGINRVGFALAELAATLP